MSEASPAILISEATLEELVEAIEARCENFVVLADKPVGSDEKVMKFYREGHIFAAIGLCQWAMTEMHKNIVDADEDED